MGKGFKVPPVVFNVSTDTMPLILDVHITVIHLVSRRHCLRKDCGSLSSRALPVDSDADLTFLWSPVLATAFRESSQRVSSFLGGLFRTKLALRWLPAAWESCWASGLLPGKRPSCLPQGKLEPTGRTALPWGGGFAAAPGHQGWRGLRHSQPRCLLWNGLWSLRSAGHQAA